MNRYEIVEKIKTEAEEDSTYNKLCNCAAVVKGLTIFNVIIFAIVMFVSFLLSKSATTKSNGMVMLSVAYISAAIVGSLVIYVIGSILESILLAIARSLYLKHIDVLIKAQEYVQEKNE